MGSIVHIDHGDEPYDHEYFQEPPEEREPSYAGRYWGVVFFGILAALMLSGAVYGVLAHYMEAPLSCHMESVSRPLATEQYGTMAGVSTGDVEVARVEVCNRGYEVFGVPVYDPIGFGLGCLTVAMMFAFAAYVTAVNVKASIEEEKQGMSEE